MRTITHDENEGTERNEARQGSTLADPTSPTETPAKAPDSGGSAATPPKALAAGLRALADWYEAHPDMPPPEKKLQVFGLHTKEEAAALVAAFGSCRKQYEDEYGLFYIEKDFGGVVLSFVFSRDEVCVRKVIGTREVSEQTIPEQVIPAHVEEIVKWECEPILAEARQ